MTTTQAFRSQKLLLPIAVISLLSACGSEQQSASESHAGNDAVEPVSLVQNNIEQVSMAMTGTLIVEERNGKTVFDAYFAQTSASKHSADPMDNSINVDSCQVSSIQSSSTNDSTVELGAANSDIEYATVGQALSIESRVGQFEALIRQELGNTIVYAPDEQWQGESLPDDSILSFESGSVFDEMGSVKVPPLLPLVWLTPETGVMSNAASSLRWEASFDEQVRIKLRLSAIDFRDSEHPTVVTVSCDLIDDGFFTLPAKYQPQLPDDDMGIVVYAVRERMRQIRVDDASFTVVQLSYPAPLKP